ncbi:MAG: hypothetical protein KKA32_09395 [Actinobacteria bacterium]|nr:hypothetical protein [Actinomycetota bacterium]
MSRRAHRALEQHAAMFEVQGFRRIDGPAGTLVLLAAPATDPPIRLELSYRVRRRLLARVYHLRVRLVRVGLPAVIWADDATSGLSAARSGEVAPFVVEHKVTGVVATSSQLEVKGPGAAFGERLAAGLRRSGALERLRAALDLEEFRIEWAPASGEIRVTVGPYPGSYLYMIIPPVHYTVRLKPAEVEALIVFFEEFGRS